MAENSKESSPLFTLSNTNQLGSGLGFGLGFFDPQPKHKAPLPPPSEVIPSENQSPDDSNAEIAIVDGLTLLKGKASTFDVFGVSNSDLVPGKYEGGLKLWEGSIDLVKVLHSEVREGRLTLKGKRVLEVLLSLC